MNLLTKTNYKMNFRNKADGMELMANVDNDSVAAAFFDPQYRGILDKLKYGNEGQKRAQVRCSLKQMDEDTITRFICEISRVLKSSGHLFLWVDKYHLCKGVSCWYKDTKLELVDMIVWDKERIGMGHRSRWKTEYLLIFQKKPIKAKGYWTDHSIPDVWSEKKTKDPHPHNKPVSLEKRLIEATTEKGDVVLDPASGSYSVLKACQMSGREFLGCDIEFGETV